MTVTYRRWPRFPRYRVGDDGTIIGPRGVLRGSRRRDGYVTVTVYDPDRRATVGVHVAVAETFHGPRPPGHEAAHANGDPGDNRAINIAWRTPAQNRADRWHCGTWGRRLTLAQVIEIRDNPTITRDEFARRFGVSPTTISHVRTFRTWRVAVIRRRR